MRDGRVAYDGPPIDAFTDADGHRTTTTTTTCAPTARRPPVRRSPARWTAREERR